MLLLVPAIQGYEGGVYNQASGCGCHSGTTAPGASVSISGLPTNYDVNKLYQSRSLSVGEFLVQAADSH